MSTLIPGSEPDPTSEIDYHAAEGLTDGPPAENPIGATAVDDGKRWREWMMVGVGLTALVSILAIMVSAFALATGDDSAGTTPAAAPTAQPAHEPAAAEHAAPTLADAKGIAFEPFERVDPTLPPVPAGKVKTFKVDVYQHVTQVSKDLAPTEVWSYAVNGRYQRGTGVSAPMVVNEGDTVDFTIVNGTDQSMKVDLPHSLDFHSAEVNPGKRYADLAPGEKTSYRFKAKHPGVFMYHCATQPVLMHTGAGMAGMMVVKPKHLAAVDKELWITQQEYYIGKPGGDADMSKMAANKPDVIAFNGYANQYKDDPIGVKVGEKVRMYVLNAGPSIWSAFHVIGTVFDTAHTDNGIAHDVQTVNLAPSQGGWVEFTLDEEGGFPFVNHSFGNMVKGSLGVLKTPNAPEGGGGHDMGGGPHAAAPAENPAAGGQTVNVEMGEMFIKADTPVVKAGAVTFNVKNTGSTTHGMATAIVPVKADGGMLDETQLENKGDELAAGESTTINAKLAAGQYELVCYVPGHYAAGQKLPFTVE